MGKPHWKGAGNTAPKTRKNPAGERWVCGCKTAKPAYILFCKTCGKGQKKAPW